MPTEELRCRLLGRENTKKKFPYFPSFFPKNKGLELTHNFQTWALFFFGEGLIFFSLLSSKGSGVHVGIFHIFGGKASSPEQVLLPEGRESIFGRNERIFISLRSLMLFL